MIQTPKTGVITTSTDRDVSLMLSRPSSFYGWYHFELQPGTRIHYKILKDEVIIHREDGPAIISSEFDMYIEDNIAMKVDRTGKKRKSDGTLEAYEVNIGFPFFVEISVSYDQHYESLGYYINERIKDNFYKVLRNIT